MNIGLKLALTGFLVLATVSVISTLLGDSVHDTVKFIGGFIAAISIVLAVIGGLISIWL